MPTAQTSARSPSTSALLLINEVINDRAVRARGFELQRSDVRYPLDAVLRVGRPGGGSDFAAMCEVYGLDISYQGVGFIAQQELMVGRFLRLDLSPLMRKACVVEIQVVACQPMMSSLFRVGASFCF